MIVWRGRGISRGNCLWYFLSSGYTISTIKGMLREDSQIFGKNDTHVPPEGRDLIRQTLHEKEVVFGFYEAAWAQRMSHS